MDDERLKNPDDRPDYFYYYKKENANILSR